jgi:hypothetical protein
MRIKGDAIAASNKVVGSVVATFPVSSVKSQILNDLFRRVTGNAFPLRQTLPASLVCTRKRCGFAG